MSNFSNGYNDKGIHQAFNKSAGSLLYADRQKDTEAFDVMRTKMVRGENTDEAIKDKELITNPQHDIFLKSSVAKQIERIRDNANILQLLPDIKQSIEIIIGTILSPKDMMNPTLTFKTSSKVLGEHNGALLNYLREYFVGSYKIEDKLTDMLWDILGKTGSYPEAVLPETAVDYMINSNSRITMEDITSQLYTNGRHLTNLGFLADSKTKQEASLEDLDFLSFMETVSVENFVDTNRACQSFNHVAVDESFKVQVVDNFDALKLPLLRNKVSRQATHDVIQRQRESVNNERINNLRMDSFEDIRIDTTDYTRAPKDQKDLQKLYADRQFKSMPVMRVRSKDNLDRESTGHPLVIKLPAESVIPVFNPMNPREHIGYYVLIEPNGYAVRLTDLDNMYKMLQTSSNVASSSSVLSFALQQSANAGSAAQFDINQMSMMEGIGRAQPIFQQMIERELLDRISRGTVGAGLKLSNTETPMLIMLARALQGKQTQALYVPSEILSYLAVDYDEFGLGKTLLDDSKMIAALRSMNIIVNSIASSKNAITKRILNADLDPAEKNPQKALHTILHEYVKGTQAEYPIVNNPVDQINYLQMAGVQIAIGEHPRLPSTKIAVDYIDNQYRPIDTTFDDWLKKLHIQATGLSPEVVEGAGSADFATQTVLANVLTARRIDLLSTKFCSSLSDFIRTYTYNSQILMDGLVKLIETNKIRLKANDQGKILSPLETAIYFLGSVEVSLPPPDTTKIKEQKEAFQSQAEFYEEALKYIFDPEFLTEEDLGRLGNMDSIAKHQKFMKADFMRGWMKENGVMTELFDILGTGEDGKPLLDFNERRSAYMEKMAGSIFPMMQNSMKRSGDINAKLDKFEETLTNEPVEPGASGGGGGGYQEDTFQDDSQFEDDTFSDAPDTSIEETATETQEENPDEQNPDEPT
jgi:hypothetical protein